MFEHSVFTKYSYDKIPLGTDCFMINESEAKLFEDNCIGISKNKELEPNFKADSISIVKINNSSIEIKFFPTTLIRHHGLTIFIPKEMFIDCVSADGYDTIRLVVKEDWINRLHKNYFSIHVLIDSIGMTNQIKNQTIRHEILKSILSDIELLSTKHKDIAFIAFADSILLKCNWQPGDFVHNIKYTYNPEKLFEIFDKIREIYNKHAEMNTYAIFSQGYNVFNDADLIYKSPKSNFISFNSLGNAFAQLFSIDEKVKSSIKGDEKCHKRYDIYMDSDFYYSLKLNNDFRQAVEKMEIEQEKQMLGDDKIIYNDYEDKLSSKLRRYYFFNFDKINKNLKQS